MAIYCYSSTDFQNTPILKDTTKEEILSHSKRLFYEEELENIPNLFSTLRKIYLRGNKLYSVFGSIEEKLLIYDLSTAKKIFTDEFNHIYKPIFMEINYRLIAPFGVVWIENSPPCQNIWTYINKCINPKIISVHNGDIVISNDIDNKEDVVIRLFLS